MVHLVTFSCLSPLHLAANLGPLRICNRRRRRKGSGVADSLTQFVQLLSGVVSFEQGRFQMLILLLKGHFHEFLKGLTLGSSHLQFP